MKRTGAVSPQGKDRVANGMSIKRGKSMARDRKLAEVARSIHRASERLWARVVERDKYDVAPADVQTLQRLTTELSRAITKLKLKAKK